MFVRAPRYRIARVGLAALAWSFCLLAAVFAQGFPAGPIRIVVPTAPGTPPDIISRIIAQELSDAEGWRVVVENRPGATMTIGATEVIKQAADGQTIFAMSVPISAAPALLQNMPFKLNEDFTPIIKVSTSYNVLVVHPDVPAKSVPELVAHLKSHPDKLNFSSGGFGTPAHLIGEMFKQQTGVRTVHVPYQQFPQAIADLLNGTSQYMFITTLPVVDLVASGKLRALAVTGPKRLASMPNIPTIVEQGFAGLAVEDWVGLAVKSGTPDDIVLRLNGAINKALAKPSVGMAFAKLGAEPAGGTPAAFRELLSAQIEHWAKVVTEAGIKNRP